MIQLSENGTLPDVDDSSEVSLEKRKLSFEIILQNSDKDKSIYVTGVNVDADRFKKFICNDTLWKINDSKTDNVICSSGVCKVVNFVNDKIINPNSTLVPSKESVANTYDNLMKNFKSSFGGMYNVLSILCSRLSSGKKEK